jgi:hypothetical protein
MDDDKHNLKMCQKVKRLNVNNIGSDFFLLVLESEKQNYLRT